MACQLTFAGSRGSFMMVDGLRRRGASADMQGTLHCVTATPLKSNDHADKKNWL
jgi:hypothetical protein